LLRGGGVRLPPGSGGPTALCRAVAREIRGRVLPHRCITHTRPRPIRGQPAKEMRTLGRGRRRTKGSPSLYGVWERGRGEGGRPRSVAGRPARAAVPLPRPRRPAAQPAGRPACAATRGARGRKGGRRQEGGGAAAEQRRRMRAWRPGSAEMEASGETREHEKFPVTVFFHRKEWG
jgi:hypothetical protein